MSDISNVVGFAYEVLYMQRRILELEERVKELEQYEQKYTDLVDNAYKSSVKSAGTLLSVLLKPGVAEAFAKSEEK